MSSYLLSWNPKNFSTGGEGSDQGTLDYEKEEIIRWSCHSKQVAAGDHVYLIKLGKGSRGIIAKGVVTKSSYIDKCWKDATKERTYIDFRVEDIRHNCNEGLVPQVLLLKACPEQQWSPQSSGILIKPEYEETVNELWQQGTHKHSLALLFDWLNSNEFTKEVWYEDYKSACNLKYKITSIDSLSDELLHKIWLKKANGIASVGNGFMYQREVDENKVFLQKLTLDILTNPTKETFDKTFDDWKHQEGFSRTLYSVLHRVFSLADPEHITSVVGKEYLNQIISGLNLHFELSILHTKHWLEDNHALIRAVTPYIEPSTDIFKRNILIWHLYLVFSLKYDNSNSSEATTAKENEADGYQIMENKNTSTNDSDVPRNQILYGPPGTGKTYHSIQAAVKAAEPEKYSELGIDENVAANPSQRTELTRLYRELYNAGRIGFVTFHQSYGYEEFVEGLKASSDDGNISYDIEDGVFKRISVQAEKFSKPKEAESNYSFEKAWQVFTEQLAEKEFVEVKMSKTSFKVLDFNDSRIFFEKKSGSRDHTLSISTLRAIFEERREYNSGLGVYYHPLVKYLKELSEPEQMPAVERQNFVLIIDEINRGNISKIFGELITLIEPSKRSGQSEAIEVTLPYSGDKFSVPDNLYIIGTMNTADRSLALMDTALRRRFDFVEMMPDYSVLYDDVGLPFKVESDGCEIDLASLLETMNNRISVLYDREHQLGHAFLMPVVKAIAAGESEKALHELKNCFQNKIIPLLAEYFFEDWQKIRLVLGDNQKTETYQLIEQLDIDFDGLFGSSDDVEYSLDDVKNYKLIDPNSKVWLNAETYIRIYEAGNLPKDGA